MEKKKAPPMTVEQFNALPKNKQRVLVAQDVIANLKAKKIQAETGVYVDSLHVDTNWSADVRSNFDKLKGCNVCAMGACLISYAKFKNQLTFNDLDDATTSYYSDSKSLFKLAEIFTPEQLTLIEYAFEQNQSSFSERVGLLATPSGGRKRAVNIKLYDRLRKKIERLMYLYDGYDDNSRLMAIMQNIIDNDGEFVVSKD